MAEESTFPQYVTPDLIKHLAKIMDEGTIDTLRVEMGLHRVGTALFKVIKDQVPTLDEYFTEMSTHCYVQRELDLNRGLTVKWRTLTAEETRASLAYAREQKGTTQLEMQRQWALRQLAYSIVSINGRLIGGDAYNISYLDGLAHEGVEMLRNVRNKHAQLAYDQLGVMPETVVQRMLDARALWEQCIADVINGSDSDSMGEVLGNSPATPGKSL